MSVDAWPHGGERTILEETVLISGALSRLSHFSLPPSPHLQHLAIECFLYFHRGYRDYLIESTMAEKRKLPARDRRESAAKRRVSEATPQSHKKKAPTPRAPTPEPVDAPLPTKVKDGDPLPIVRMRQSLSLSDNEYQSIAERFAIAAAPVGVA